ncbi:ATP-binding protein, partial [Chloroflexota bacterium]
KKDLPEDVKKDIDIILEGGKRVAGIVSRMLTFARQSKPQKGQVNINELIENTLEMRAAAMKLNDINVDKEMDRELPGTVADGGQLQQVFLNIILNAETEMSKAYDEGSLLIRTERINNAIRISFRDDGPGIEKENLEKVFDPFFTTREVGKGTGLGLSICHGIIAEHGGRIHAESEKGKGTTFIIDLPIVTEGKRLETPEPEFESTGATVSSKVLVIDDELTVQQYLTNVLTDEGHEVEVIDNGDDAIQKAGEEEYDVILLDIKMPGRSGIEIYNELRKKSAVIAKKIVFITGDVMGQDTESFLLKVNAPYIVKPFDTEQILNGIDRILSRKS